MSRRRQTSSPVSLFAFQDIITATTGILILLAMVLALSVIIQGAHAVVEIAYADDSQIAYRDALLAEVEALQQMSTRQEAETASWSSATPSEMKQKVETTQSAIERLQSDLTEKGKTLSAIQNDLSEVKSTETIAETESDLLKTQEQIAEALAALQSLKAGNRIVYNFRQTTRTPWLAQIARGEILAAKANSADVKKFTSYQAFNRFAVGLPQNEQYVVMLVKPSGVASYDAIKSYLDDEKFDLGTELIGENQSAVDPVNGTRLNP